MENKYNFTAYGHHNVQATHKTTIEFTKDKDLTPKGDCIAGVKADFSLNQLKEFINNLKNKKIRIIIKVDDLTEEINCEIDPDFDDDKEMVIRKSGFRDRRTFGVKADKGAGDLSKELIIKLKNFEQKIIVIILE